MPAEDYRAFHADCCSSSGVIKKKLFTDVDGDSVPTAPSESDLRRDMFTHLITTIDTPAKPKPAAKGKKAAATPTPSKKRTKKDVENEDGDEDDEGRALVNKRNKSSAVKKIVKAEDSDDE